MSEESSDHGKHRDCNPSSKISFGIPILYEEGKTHGPQFSNGALGKPWLISLMLYVTAPNFKPEYQMGTTFYDESNQAPVRVDSQHMRLVLFESDLLHSIEASKIPAGISTWRLSYVFKLIVNPRKENTRVKEGLRSFLIE
ncbi:MAG TPA: hypothetical protein VJK48_04075 [Chlamydiales bacterium]|nr:hypothetical protein [Chlamydiales bacterium]